jgi:acyl carrier protein
LSQNPKLEYNPPPDGSGHAEQVNKEAIMMPREEIRQILLELFENETGETIASLHDDQGLSEQLGLDSVDMVSLIMQLERRFKIRLAHDELANAHRVGLLLDLVQRKLVGDLKRAA